MMEARRVGRFRDVHAKINALFTTICSTVVMIRLPRRDCRNRQPGVFASQRRDSGRHRRQRTLLRTDRVSIAATGP